MISLPDFLIYAAIGSAVAVTLIPLAIVLIDKRKGVASIEHSTLNIPQENIEISNIPPLIILPAEIQKSMDRAGEDTAEQKKQPVKQLTMQVTKLICPACRKEFNLPL